jgi:ubiquinone/menaquinone biosynthesis C-methylase UbiE
MSSFVWMRVLESAPERYDRGIRILSRGRIDAVYQELAGTVAAPGRRVLDLGCGTGGVSLACAARGAKVFGVDRNAGMLEVARSRPGAGAVEWMELGAAEIEDRFPERSLDGVVSCLVFSEMSAEEQAYVLSVCRTRLVRGGLLAIADEVRPDHPMRRLLSRLARAPLVALTFLLTQTTTRPVEHLAERVRKAGFMDVVEARRWGGTFAIVRARAGAG